MSVKAITTIESNSDAREALTVIADYKRQIAQMDEAMRETQAELIDWMEDEGKKSLTADDGDNRISGTIVRGTRIVIDEGRLKKLLGAKLWNKVTKKVLDKSKLEDLIVRNEIDPMEVATCSNELDNKPYIKVTVR